MDEIYISSSDNIGRNFIPNEFLPPGKDEYYFRNQQTLWPQNHWRKLTQNEIDQLIKNGNHTDDWNSIVVADPFDVSRITNNKFYGLVRIGSINNQILEYKELKLSAGISNSCIISSDIGDNAAVHNVHYLAHYIIGNQCILFNIDEMLTTNSAKFGNGIIKDGESDEDRVWIEVINEAGGRAILPFEGINTADAYLWAKYRDDQNLQNHLKELTQKQFDSSRGYYGLLGNQSVIKNTRNVIDVKTGKRCYIHGANKLHNLTIHSSDTESSEIGDGVELVNGIIGYGCKIVYGSKAIRFVLGNNTNLKYGARLFNTFLGDNSTISCCEVLNNLIFPAHEQHHNNSFLIASLVMGQSNIAAGATIGSNHNSRANDNEIQAGRGFWPGLCSSVKHYSRFASYVLLAKGDYPAELDIPFPFALLNNNVSKNRLEVMPAYWWLYNMYALARNTWKFKDRDNRKFVNQHIEFEALAPDTIEEIIHARKLLEIFTGKAILRHTGKSIESKNENELAEIGRELLVDNESAVNELEVPAENMEKSRRKVLIIKAHKAYHAYSDMMHYYAINQLLDYLENNNQPGADDIHNALKSERVMNWINCGGQLIPEPQLNQLRLDIIDGKMKKWNDIHKRYDELWKQYPIEKQKHAYQVLCHLLDCDKISAQQWDQALDRAVSIQEFVNEQVYKSRGKDYNGHFNQMTFRNHEELTAVNGSIDDNSFIRQLQTETELYKQRVQKLKNRM
ncbi:MAG: DUF4954 family protein [Calditrichaceae bacterium]